MAAPNQHTKKKYFILMMDISEPRCNVSIALNEDMELHLVETEDQALKYMDYEYSKHYRFYGLVPSPEVAFEYYKEKEKKPKRNNRKVKV